MAAGVVPSANSSILEVLNLYNYEDWSLRVETYLIAEGLWDVVEATAETPNNGETEYREWRMKNAKALHTIQNSCRTDVFGFICDIRMAKDAWETLANRLKPKNRDIKGMAATVVPSLVIDLKGLTQDNYEHWSFWVRKYLLAEDLWDVVQGTSEAPKPEDGEGEAEYMAWRKNNARALHVITIFSGQDAQSCISDIQMAKDAWNTLAEKFDPPQILETPEEDSEVVLNDDIDSNDGDSDLETVENRGDVASWNSGETALSMAIQNRDTEDAVEIVKCIVEKNRKLLLRVVHPSANAVPLQYALNLDRPTMARYLYSVTSPTLGKLKSRDAAELVSTGLRLKYLDISLDLLRRFPKLAIAKDHSSESPLNELASTRAGLFLDDSQLGIWKRLIYICNNEHDKTLFQFAAEHRQDEIFVLIYIFWLIEKKKTEEFLSRKDKFGNNMLHVVGKLSPLTQIAHIRGAAFQMQYELQWFKKVESMASPKDHNCINSDGLTPREVFTINHRDLVKEAELSMKETATSSSALVAALIITIMFAAVVTVPGGINGETGIPIYLNTDAFRIFIIADVISLCSSTTSVMVFLGILTSRFAEEDFLTSLPTKLIIGFLSLFLSIGSMMVAFASAVFIMLPGKPSIVIPSIVLAGVPIASFLWMQFPFLREIIISTFGSSFLSMYLSLKRCMGSHDLLV
ncbi:hypothetical protein ACLB2K_068036 [Fragaria x ananassa]